MYNQPQSKHWPITITLFLGVKNALICHLNRNWERKIHTHTQKVTRKKLDGLVLEQTLYVNESTHFGYVQFHITSAAVRVGKVLSVHRTGGEKLTSPRQTRHTLAFASICAPSRKARSLGSDTLCFLASCGQSPCQAGERSPWLVSPFSSGLVATKFSNVKCQWTSKLCFDRT